MAADIDMDLQREGGATRQSVSVGMDIESVTAALSRWAGQAPDRTAYLFLEDGEREGARLTYAELEARARAIAAGLARSFAPGERALLLYPPGLDFIAAFLGCLYAGIIAVPAYPPRSSRMMPRLLAILADAQPAVALASTASAQRVRGWLERMPEAAALPWLTTDEIEPAPAGWEPAAPQGDAVAFLQYTSGSTSTPKGVMVTHDNLAHNQVVIRDACGHAERSVFVSWLPPYHDLGLIGNLLQAVYVGGSCVLMSPTAFLQRPVRWLQAVSRYGATTSGGPNFAWDLCVRKVTPEQRRELDLSRWEVAFNGAEPVRAATLTAFADAFAESGFRPRAFYPCYGLAEATLMVSGGRPGEEPVVRSFAAAALAAGQAVETPAEDLRPSRLVGCGAVLAGQRLAIVDPVTGERRGAGEVGEIWLSGPSVAAGYWRRPEETAEAFGARLADGTGPFLRTGDLGFLENGELFIAGRLKDLVILRGRNHYPQDLEATAAASHPAFAGGLAAAFSVEHGGEERLVLVQEVGRRSDLDPEAAAAAIRRAVAEEHEAHVEEVVLIPAGALPRTSSGKVQRRLCRTLLLDGELEVRGRSVLAPSAEEAEPVLSREELLVLPADRRRAGLEGWLRRRVARATGVDPARLPVDRPLSELGFDSLMAAEVKNDLEEGLGIALPLAALLEGPTLAQLAEAGLEGLDGAGLLPLPELPAPEPTDEQPLSLVQEAIWFLQRLAPEGAAYNISLAARLPATADSGALDRALTGLVARHAALRTTFGEREGRPFQREGPPPASLLAAVDTAGWSQEELLARLTEEANHPFDLEKGVLRAVLYRGGPGEPVLLLTVHHLALDGRSFWRLLEELGERYQAEIAGGGPLTLPPRAGYRDFVAWQRALLAGPEGERLARFWGRLRGTPTLDLPTDRPRAAAAAAPAGATVRFAIDRERTGALRALAAAQRTTLFAVVLAAFETFLSRWSGQEEFLLGTAVSGRGRRELDEVVGCFFNVVPVRAEAGPEVRFTGHLRRVHAAVRSALEHQDYPSHLLANDLGGTGSGPRLFPAVLLWQRPQWVGGASELFFDGTGWRLDVHGLRLEPLPVERRFARQEIELEVIDAGDGLAALLHYDADLFGAETAARMARHLQVLLGAIAADPEAPLADLRLMDPVEERWLREGLNHAERTYALPVAVHDLFAQQAARTPDGTAAVGPRESLTYRELHERSSALASQVQRLLPVSGPLDRLVGLLADPDPEVLTGMLGILKAGCGFVPLDPRFPDERLAWMLEDCACAVLVTQRRHLERAAGLARYVLCLDELGAAGTAAFPALERRDPRELRATAYIVYTSGSTGRPKGVPVSHESLVPMLVWGCESLGLGAGTRVLQSLSFCFDFGIFEELTTVLAGGTLFYPEAVGDLAAFARDIARHGINTLHTTPAFARELAAAGGADGALEGLEIVHLGGEALARDTVARIRQAAPRAAVYNGYGPTEATVNSSLFRVDGAEAADGQSSQVLPIGRRSADNALYILDRAGGLVPFGARGELHVGGIGVARGYLHRPDLTAARFVPDPFGGVFGGPGGRLYRTGDLVRYLPGGDIEFLGRIDQQVKIRGFRVEPGEIEAALREHPAVREAAVIARPDLSGNLRLLAYVAAEDGTEAPELRAFLAHRLPPHMVPSVFTFLPALPLNASGKVDRRALPEPAEAQADGPYAAPRTPLEEALAGIWSRSLGVERVGIHDDFFELGGHSLLGTRIIAQIRSELGVEVALRTFFESPTVAELAAAVEGAGRVDLPPILPVSREMELPLSFPQERIWFLTQLDPELRSYNVPRALRVRGQLDPALVETTFSEINRRHEILRTVFPTIDGRPVQVIHPPFRMTMPVVDLSGLPEAMREKEMRRRILVEGRRTFDLTRGPLLRLTLLRLAAEEHTLVITEHHLVHDGWTQGVLLRDFLTIYDAFSRGEPSPLPELPVQYADFAVWQRRWLRDEVLERQIAYWKERLTGAPTVLNLPTDRPRPAVQSFHGHQVSWVLPAEMSRAVRSVGRRLGSTLFMTMFAAWDTLLMRLSGQEDLCMGTGVANRRVVEAEGLLGMVINTLVLRADLSGAPTFAELVTQIREMCVGAYGHQDVPFEKLVNALGIERSLSHTPLFQVFFAFLDTPMPELELPGLTITVLDAHNRSAKFDINVTVLLPNEQRVGIEGQRQDEITLLFEYSTDLFDETTALRLLEQYQVLLGAAVADPELRLPRLPLLTPAAAHQLLAEWNDAAAPGPADLCLHDLVFAQARRTPEGLAVRCGGERLTYAELAGRAARLADHLRARGIGPGALVGLSVDRSAEMVGALLGILASGAAYVPLDPTFPRERLALMVEDARPALLLAEERLAGSLPAGAPVLFLEQTREEPARVPAAAARPTPDDLAYVLYTSGSTGRPKGVAIPHRAVVNFLDAVRRTPGLAAGDALLALTTLSFDIAVLELFLPLTVGGTVVVATREETRGGAELRAALADPAITTVQATPATWRLLLESGWEGDPRLRALCGGEALPRELADRLLERCGELWNLYGPTETTVWSMTQRVGRGRGGAGTVPVGRPLGNTSIHLLDREGSPVPLGVHGELWIGGAGLALGYLGRPDLTAAAFRPDPFAHQPGARLYHTGDLARRLPDGTVEFLGRIDHQVKVRGFRIELGDIESHLARHPGVRAAAAAIHEATPEDRRVVAYLVAAAQPAPSVDELRSFLAASLPEYMLPATWVWLEALPLTPNGKVDRKALPRPEADRPVLAVPFVAPRTGLERALAAAWCEVLGTDEVGIHDNFFGRGGHSLLGTRLMARIESRLGVALPLRALFEAPTVAALAARVEQALQGEAGRTPAPPLVAGPRPDELPLSFAQERLWILDQIEPGNTAYNIPCAVRLHGALDQAALARALSEVVRRHEALRTRFAAVSGEPRQVVEPAQPIPLPVIDLAGASEAEALRLALSEATRPFDLAHPPLLRACLLRHGAEDHLLVLTLHHIAADGWSLGILVRELAAVYQGVALADLPLQYADFSLWQRRWLSGAVLEREVAWWRERLAGAPEEILLPVDRPRTAVPAHRGASCRATLPLPPALLPLCREQQATLFMAVLATFAALLSRWSDADDLVVGSPVANRNRVEVEGLIGFFANMLPLRVDLAGQPAFADVLARVRETTLAASAHQEIPFEKLVEALQPPRHPGRTPLFHVSCVLQNAPFEAVRIPGLSWHPLPLETGTAKFDLTLVLEQREEGLAAALEYSRDLFDTATAERLLEHWRNVLDGAAAAPDTRIAELPLLSRAEHRQAVAGWNETRTSYPRAATLQSLFEAQVEATPEATAIVGEGVAWSYRELNRRANRLAHHLRTLGVGPEDPVALCLERSPELIATLLGILKAGGVYVPLDPSYPRERLRFLLEDSGARLVVSREALIAELSLDPAQVVDLDCEADTLVWWSEDNPLPAGSADQVAYVMYTSGSTGRPKGVAVPHRAVVRLVQGTDFVRLGPAEVFLQLAPASFDASTFEIWGALLHGARLVVQPGRVPSLDELGAALARHGVTTLWLTAGLFHQMVDERLESLSGVRQLLAGGDVLSPAHVRRVLTELPGCTLINGYGPTENTTFTCCRRLTGPGELGGSVPIGSIPIGQPIANTRVHLLDRALQPVPVGVPGELYAGGDGLARGYVRRPELTAERFVPDPFAAEAGEPGGRLYRTGDLVRRRADGDIEFLGRIDQQVKIRGFRVELGEIEACLGRHPQVRAAAATVYEAAPGDRRIAAYLAGSPVDPAELRRFLAESLPEPMLPSAWVWLEALPLTPNGKVDRKALPRPESERPDLSPSFVAPRTELERTLAAAWGEVLGVDEVGIHDDFFVLGGHSLLGMRLVARIESRLGVAIPLRTLFEAPTVAGLAASLEAPFGGEAGLGMPPLPAAATRPAELPLSFAQERLWLLDQIDGASAVYNIPCAVHLAGALDPAALERALREVVRRHEALRTRFAADAGAPRQVIEPPPQVALPVVDAAGISEAEALRLAASESARPFDLARPPLLRALLLRRGAGDHILLLTLHHIAADGWSLGVLVRELVALYQGEALPELPLQYADFALWQRRWLSGERLEQEVAWWRQRLAGAPEELPLPADRPRTAAPSHRGGLCRATLPLPAELGSLCREQQATLFMVLLAGFASVLSRWSGEEDLVVGSPVANRNRVETEGLIGFFVNMLPLRVDLAGQPTFAALLARVRDETLAAYAHQDLPFEKLVETLQPSRHLGRTPLFQVSLALQNAPFAPVEVPGLAWRPLPLATGTAKFDLALSLSEGAEGLQGTLEYSADLFEAGTAGRLFSCFATFLAAALAAPARRISELPLLSDAEQSRLLGAATGPRTAPLPPALAHHRFEEQARRRPEALAVVCGERSLTYGEVDRRASRLAARLRRLGVGLETPVGLCIERSPEVVVGMVAVLKAGGAFVPLDPAQPARRVALSLEDAGAPVLLTQSHVAARLGRLPGDVLLLDEHDAGDGAPLPALAGPVPAAGNRAYIIYTSGSTGRPKGVEVSHGALLNLVSWHLRAHPVAPGERATQLAGLSFDATVWELWPYLAAGAEIHMPADEEARLDPVRLRDFLLASGARYSFLPTALAEAVLRLDWPAGAPLAVLFTGGERLHLHPPAGLPFTLVNDYGPTENAVVATSGPVPPGPAERGLPPLGEPLDNVEVLLLDRFFQLAPPGCLGELCLGGESLARGYRGRPDLTAERFVPHPWSRQPGARLYRTGDLARRRPSGEIEFLGRIDHQVKIRGFRIELGEIEAVLATHPAVREAAVVARGEGADRRLVAYVLPADGVRNPGDLLRAHLRESLPEPMVPAAFVTVESLPLTPSGKVDRQSLAASGLELRDTTLHSDTPRTSSEDLLAGIWSEVLGLERVGIHDGFFDLGGHSLLAARVVSRLREAFGVDLPLRTLFERPSVAALSEHLDALTRQSRGLAAPPLERVSRSLEPPLSFAQQSFWVIDQVEGGNTAYNGTVAVELAGRLDVAALAGSFRDVVERHEILRTSFALRNGEPRQVIQPAVELPLPLADLTALPEDRREEALRAIRRELRQPFDFARAPLLRPALLRLAPDLHNLVLCQHHIISDAWSMGVLIRELAACYEARAQGRRPALPALPVQYADWSHWQRQWLRGDALDRLLAFWRRQLGSAPPAARLPIDRPAPAVRTSRGGQLTLPLPAELEPGLRALARREGVTLFMLLLGVFQTLLHRSTSQEDLVLVVAVSGRDRLETEGLIGCFLNMLPLRASLAGDPSFRRLLQRVRETCLDAFAHQDLPFERLVGELRLRGTDGRSPFQVAFGVRSAPPPLPALPELAMRPLDSDPDAARLDLTLWITERPEGLSASWTYSADLFERDEVERLHGLYEALLAAVVADPEARLRDLALSVPPDGEAESAHRRRWEDLKKRKLRESHRRSVRSGEEIGRPDLS